MSLFILNKQALANIDDLTTPSATAKYPIGYEIVLQDSITGYMKKYIYVKNLNASTTAKSALIVGLSGTAGSELVVTTPATSAVYQIAGVANTAVAANYYFFLQTYGDTTVVSTTDTTAGNTGILANAVTTVTDSAAATETGETFCVIKDTVTGSVDCDVFLVGKRIIIVTP